MDLSRIVLSLRSEPRTVGDSLEQLLTALEDGRVDERTTAEGYLREVARLTINWMARSEENALREAHQRIEAVFATLGPAHPANHHLSDAVWVALQVRGISLMISTYLRTDNLAKSLGFLAGRRRESWRRALEKISELRRAVTASELVDERLFDHSRTASNALTQLSAHGLVENVSSSGTGRYVLTWAGESAANVLTADLVDRVSATDDIVDPSVLARPTEADRSAQVADQGVPAPEPRVSQPSETAEGPEPSSASTELMQKMLRVFAEALANSRAEATRGTNPAPTYTRGPSEQWTESPRAPTARGGEQEIEALELMGAA